MTTLAELTTIMKSNFIPAMAKMAEAHGDMAEKVDIYINKMEEAEQATKDAAAAVEEAAKKAEEIAKKGWGGKILDFADKLVNGVSDTDKFLGMKTKSIRKAMIAMLPRGTFRLITKFGTALNVLQTIYGVFTKNAEGNANIIGKSFNKLGKGFKKIGGFVKGGFGEDMKKLSGGAGAFLKTTAFSPLGRKMRQGGGGVAAVAKSGITKKAEAFNAKVLGGILKGVGFSYSLLRLNKDGKERWKTMWKKTKGFMGRVGGFVWQAAKFMLVTMLILGVTFLLIKKFGPQLKEAFKTAWKVLKYAWGIIAAGISDVWTGLKGVWNALFGDGTFMDLLISVWVIVWGLLQIVWGILVGVFGTIIGFIAEFVGETWNRFKTWISDMAEKSLGKVIAIGVAIAAVVVLLFGWPVILAIALGVAIFALSGEISNIITDSIPKFAKAIADAIGGVWEWATGWTGLASGGVSAGGMTVVGERGPELLNLPKGSRVHSNTDSRKMLSNTGGNTINITINARDTSDSELRRIADKIGNMVNNKINRSSSSRMLG